MKIIELQNLLNNQPKVASNTMFIGFVYVLCWSLAIPFFIIGIALLCSEFFNIHVIIDWISNRIKVSFDNSSRWTISKFLGFVSLIFGIVLVGITFLCRMLLKRNHFIIQMEDWIADNIQDIKKNFQKNKK